MTALYLETFPGRVIGVTGSNGKSSTVDMIWRLLSAGGQRVFYGGNERSKAQALTDIEQADAHSLLVLEISNRQLKYGLPCSPEIAVITNVTPNHIPEHGSFVAYQAAKQEIFRQQSEHDLTILNADDPVSGAWADLVPGRVWLTSSTGTVGAGVYLVDNQVRLNPGAETVCDLPFGMPHMRQNALAAIAAAKAVGTDNAVIARVMAAYEPLPGRLESVGTVNGISYYYDIKSTVPQATLAALESLVVAQTPPTGIILFLGGEDKGADYERLAARIDALGVRLILLPGSTTELLAQALLRLRSTTDLFHETNFDAAWLRLLAIQKAGDNVLLSPAGAGFYSRFLEGKVGFRQRVDDLAAEVISPLR